MRPSAIALHREISACTVCAEHLPLGPRPVTQFSATSTILIIGQAPGTKVHTSGVPWQDDSGDRLRDWMGIDAADFYDPGKVALVPMGFCYPGKRKGGDAPPRPECAPRWHDRILSLLPPDRLTLLVGSYAQEHYLPKGAGKTLLERVRGFGRFAPAIFATPHPSWRSIGWQSRNPWFESELLPILRAAVQRQLDRK
jgi:uracil-DNA glycosylase